jgi:uncharacterized membrane-anchored protein YitT (DUF2179 family)
MNKQRSWNGWRLVSDLVLLTLGAFISAIGVIVFQAPFDIAPGGVSGIAIILNYLFSTPIGLMVLLLNIPIQLLAFRYLGGWRVILGTVFAVVLYSFLIDTLMPLLTQTLSDDRLLNALYGGVIGGIGGGLVFRGGGTLGGTSTIGRVLQELYGIPLATSTLYTDSGVVVLAGLVFGWEGALYAVVTLYIGGVVADYTLEGPSVIRTATIITDYPAEVSQTILAEMKRGVTAWDGMGMYTQEPRGVLFITIGRQQVDALRRLVLKADPNAFVVFSQGHTAYGRGFREGALRAPRDGEGA